MSSETMATLATEYQKGILIASVIVCSLYVAMVVISTIVRYKRTGKLSILGVFPIIHIFLLFMNTKCSRERAWEREKAKKGTEVFDDIF